MRARLLPAASRIARVPRGDGRTLFVALLLFAIMALVAAIFTKVVPAPFAESAPPAPQSAIPHPDASLNLQVSRGE